MNKKLVCALIVMGENRGTVQFNEKKGDKITSTVIVNYTDPKEAVKYEQGKEYTLTIKA